MAGWTEADVTDAWRALARSAADSGWKFIPLARIGAVEIRVACRFPGGMEALVLVPPGNWRLRPAALPKGRGFDAELLEDDRTADGIAPLGLVRRGEGSPEIFAVMIVDLLRLLGNAAGLSGPALMERFLARLEEWQDFMSRRRRALTGEEQTGLMGELVLLERLASGPLAPEAALATWQGPLHAVQDFHIGAGSLEVKSTTATDEFPARIGDIGQLDPERLPMFLCAFRFAVDDAGRTLVEQVAQLRARFEAVGCRAGFDALLLVAGYADEHAPQYGRRLLLRQERAFPVEDPFPRLRRSELPAAILRASYRLDLDAVEAPVPVDIDAALATLGL